MSEKIFVGLDEEIIFLTEKIRKTEGDRVILIVPERASLLGSIVSLRLLFSEIAKSNKKAVLITKDDIGIKLAKKADFVAYENVGEISKESWERAGKRIRKFKETRERKKEKLISERNETKSQNESSKKEKGEHTKEKQAKEEESILEPKMVKLGGFQMVSGGDIAEFEENKAEEEEFVDKKAKTQENEKTETANRKETAKDEGLVGRDLSTYSFTSMSKAEDKGTEEKKTYDKVSFISKEKLESTKLFLKGFFSAKNKRSKFIFAIGVVLIVFLVLSYFVFPKGRVLIKVESRDINLEKQIIADTSASVLDVEALTIPAVSIEASDDQSETAQATGKKEIGDKASGTVVIYNLTESEVVVKSGTVLEELESGNRYTTSTEVTVPAKKPDDDPENPGLIGNIEVGISAESFGDQYNISGSKKKFRISGFDLENLYAKNFVDVTGGTTEEISIVSEEDKEKLKKKIVENLKTTLVEKLKNEAGLDREVLLDTIKYEEVLIQAKPDVGGSENVSSFNMSVTFKANALSFNKEDLDLLAQQLVEKENSQQVEIEKFEYNSKIVDTQGEQIKINLSITGVVTPSVDEQNIKVSLAGKNLSRAEEYLDGLNEVRAYELELSPSWFPTFLKHFPSSTDRIEVDIKKIENQV